MKNLIKDYRYNYAYFFGGFMKYNAPFILIGIFVTMWLYCPWVKPYAEDLHHKVDSVLGIHEDEHKPVIEGSHKK